jgi:ribosomal protein S18 acetylase RimI-like enzyme
MRPLALDRDTRPALVPGLPDWILDAGNPYLEWFLGGRERARTTVLDWLGEETSELAARWVTIAYDRDRAIGGFVALPGRDVARARRADLLWLLKATSGSDRDAIRRRLQESRELFLPVEESHRYLSKIGLVREYRGHGHGGELLDAFLRYSFDAEYEHVRLDVFAGNQRAVRLFGERGFVVIGEREIGALAAPYLAMTLARSSRA